MTNNYLRLIQAGLIITILIIALAISGKSKSNSFEIERKDYEYLLDRAKKFESVRTNKAKIEGWTNEIIYISIANLLRYEIKVQGSQPAYPVKISGGLAINPIYDYIRIPIELKLRISEWLFFGLNTDLLALITTNKNNLISAGLFFVLEL